MLITLQGLRSSDQPQSPFSSPCARLKPLLWHCSRTPYSCILAHRRVDLIGHLRKANSSQCPLKALSGSCEALL